MEQIQEFKYLECMVNGEVHTKKVECENKVINGEESCWINQSASERKGAGPRVRASVT